MRARATMTGHGPFNYILAAMAGVEWSHFAAVGLGYYRINTPDDVGSKKGNNWLAGPGFAYTPVDERTQMLSLQIGLAAEVHDPDVTNGTSVVSGGWEVFASPTVVWMPAARARFFTYVSLQIAQGYRADYQVDQWRAGLGVIYSFDRGSDAAVTVPPPRLGGQGDFQTIESKTDFLLDASQTRRSWHPTTVTTTTTTITVTPRRCRDVPSPSASP